MTVRAKLISIVVFVALLPVSISAFTMLRVHSASMSSTLAELHTRSAELGATHADTFLAKAREVLTGLVRERIDWAALTPEERSHALWLVYEQLDSIAFVSLFDERGAGLGVGAYRAEASTAEVLRSRRVISRDELTRMGAELPHAEALREGFALGTSFTSSGGAPLLPMAFSVHGAESEPWVVGVALSLGPLCKTLAQAERGDTQLQLIGEGGEPLCSAAGSTPPGAALGSALKAPSATTMRVRDRGREVLAAVTPVGSTSWRVIATQEARKAFAPGRKIRNQLMVWVGVSIVGALAAGLVLASGITTPIRALSTATSEVTKGNYECTLPVIGRDEFAQLSEAFNAMSKEVDRWNRELTERVDQRTRALQETQEQLLQSKKFAAVTAMSAGIAHEINNPLTAVISFAQVLKARAEADPSQTAQASILGSLTESALSILDIVKRMQTLSEGQAAGRCEVAPIELVRAAKARTCERLAKAEAEFTLQCDEDVGSVFVNPEQLESALEQLLDNAIRALGEGRREVAVCIRAMGSELVQIDVRDTGTGIPEELLERIFEPFFTGKENWRAKGLGLAEAKQLVTNNNGTLQAKSVQGEGTTMSIRLPTAMERSHLV